MPKLNALKVRNAKPGRHADGEGLYLLVKPTGARSWVLRVQHMGKRRDIGLGSVNLSPKSETDSEVGERIGVLEMNILRLEEAREKAAALRKLAKAGRDPVAERDREKIQIPTFAEAAEAAHSEFAKGWAPKHADAFKSSLEQHIVPRIGSRRVDSIDEAIVRDALAPIWSEKPAMARKLRVRIGQVLGYAKTRKWRSTGLDAAEMRRGLAKQARGGHFAAMPYKEVPAFFAAQECQPDTRNHQLNKSAFAIAQLAASGDVSENEAAAELRQAALESGLEPDEVDATLASGWKAGLANPRAKSAPKPLVLPSIIRATDLVAKTFAPLQWIIPNLLPEGLALLAGKPKAGKSFLTLQVCLAVSSGDYSNFGGGLGVQGDVIYFALEDSERRLKERVLQMTLGQVPARLEFSTTSPRIDEGFVDVAEQWCDAKTNPRLIVVDTFRAVTPPSKGGSGNYDLDARSIAPLLDFVRARPGLCLLVIHHTRKMDSDDPFEMISGSTGLTGVCDSLIVLRNQPLGTSLFGQGRDMEGYEISLERDLRTGGWIIGGAAGPKAKTPERQTLLDLLAEADGPMALAELAAAVAKGKDTTQRLLKALIGEGLVFKPSHGRYALASQSTQFTQSAQFAPEGIDISIF